MLPFLLLGCTPPCQPPLQPMQLTTLYFGRDIPGRAPLGEAEWAGFAATVIAPAFPDGFTTFDAQGQWRDAAQGQVMREATKVVQVASPAAAARVPRDAVIAAYKARFHQVAVGVVSQRVCAGF